MFSLQFCYYLYTFLKKFERLQVFYYCSIVDQIKLLFIKKILPVKSYVSKNDNYLSDIKDGSYYKDYIATLEKETGDEFYTFMINIDGIARCEKSTLSIWPVYLVINEIEVESRFHIHNVILAGLFVGLTKPTIEDFFLPIKKDLLNLSLGLRFESKQ